MRNVRSVPFVNVESTLELPPHVNSIPRRNVVLLEPAQGSIGSPTADTYEPLATGKTYPMATALAEVIKDQPVGTEFEVLWWLDKETQRCSLKVVQPDSGLEDPQLTLTQVIEEDMAEFSSDSSADAAPPVDETTAEVATKLNRLLGDVATVEVGDVFLGQLGVVAISTTRLVSRHGEPARFPQGYSQAVEELFKGLLATDYPWVYQVVIRKSGSSKYHATVRVLVVDPNYSISNFDDAHVIINRGFDYDLGQYFEKYDLVTNHDLDLTAVYDWRYISKDLSPRHRDLARAIQARWIHTGSIEFKRLLMGTIKEDKPYMKYLGHPKFPITLDQLPDFVALPRIETATNRWEAIPNRGPPVINSRSEGVKRTGRLADDFELSETGGTYVTEGGDEHGELIQATISILTQAGYRLWKVAQNNTSLPDIVGLDPAGNVVWIEVEVGGLSSPAGIYVNLARAMEHDVHVMVVTKNSTAAKKVADLLHEPWKVKDRRGVQLYNHSTEVRIDENTIPVLPAGANESKWWATTDDTLQLRHNGEVLAEGPIEDSVTTYEYETARYRKVDADTHVIETANGQELDRASTAEELSLSRPFVKTPHVPYGLIYAGVPSIHYQQLNQIVEYDARPGWTGFSEKDENMARYIGFIEDVYDAVTHDGVPGYLTNREAREHLKPVYRRLCMKKAPTPSIFGKALNKVYGTVSKGESGSKGKAVEHRNWVYPPELRHPDLPDFDTELLEALATGDFEAAADILEGDPASD